MNAIRVCCPEGFAFAHSIRSLRRSMKMTLRQHLVGPDGSVDHPQCELSVKLADFFWSWAAARGVPTSDVEAEGEDGGRGGGDIVDVEVASVRAAFDFVSQHGSKCVRRAPSFSTVFGGSDSRSYRRTRASVCCGHAKP